ncbi:MAG: glycoside hydrolase family 65 protein [Coriobacteriia bacterium]|nr:glycoside hydrolase family 65 protein [Coriobacteriia bacterium]
MSVWTLTYDGYDPAQERLREALCTVGNGYFATRGAAPESSAGPSHYPGTYLGGYFNRLCTEIAGREVCNESMVNMPNWLPLTFRPEGGEWFDLDSGAYEILEYTQELDLKKGLLNRRVQVRDAGGRTTTVAQRRFAHMGHRHLGALETTVLAEDWSGVIEFRSAIDGTVANTGVNRYLELDSVHLEPSEEGFDGALSWLAVETNQSRLRIGEAVRLRVHFEDEPVEPEFEYRTHAGHVSCEFAVELAEGSAVTVEKMVAVFGSRDKAISEPLEEARVHVARCRTFDELLVYHTLVWDQLWRRFETSVDPGDGDRVGMVLNLHVFHLLQTVCQNSIDLDVGVPARGLHGEAYRGHVFWDEIFIFPLMDFRLPSLTRALLTYRYRRLNEARRLAYEAGYAGALYPWQSGSNGAEETPTYHLNPLSGEWKPDNSHLQRHVNIAIAHNIWSYYQTTADEEFLAYQGAEMLVEIARFWASIATYNRALDRYEILGVIGPDEYHDGYPDAEEPGLDNNAYTNVMAAWSLCRAPEALDALRPYRQRELWERLSLEREELEAWDDISRKLKVPFHDDGVISQFDGYADLEEFNWDGYRQKYDDIQRLDRILHAEGDTPNRYKVSKQADVLMLFYLLSDERLAELFERLGYECTSETIHTTIDYYLARTSHGSTLSGIVHSWVIARRDRGRSWEQFVEALESDISDVQGGTTSEGIHLGAMAGTVDLLQRAYTGLNPREGVLWFDPALPDAVRELEMTIRYRGMWLGVKITRSSLVVTSDATDSGVCQIGVHDTLHDYEPGQTLEVSLS